ncbi:hypothetical protein D3C87_624260 [compost metagenome]
MFTILSKNTKEYLRKDWMENKGQIYTVKIDEAAFFGSWDEAADHCEDTEMVYEIIN